MSQPDANENLANAIEEFASAYGLSFREALDVITNEHIQWAADNMLDRWLSILVVCNEKGVRLCSRLEL